MAIIHIQLEHKGKKQKKESEDEKRRNKVVKMHNEEKIEGDEERKENQTKNMLLFLLGRAYVAVGNCAEVIV